jgi:hypothetical protein
MQPLSSNRKKERKKKNATFVIKRRWQAQENKRKGDKRKLFRWATYIYLPFKKCQSFDVCV